MLRIRINKVKQERDQSMRIGWEARVNVGWSKRIKSWRVVSRFYVYQVNKCILLRILICTSTSNEIK